MQRVLVVLGDGAARPERHRQQRIAAAQRSVPLWGPGCGGEGLCGVCGVEMGTQGSAGGYLMAGGDPG